MLFVAAKKYLKFFDFFSKKWLTFGGVVAIIIHVARVTRQTKDTETTANMRMWRNWQTR